MNVASRDELQGVVADNGDLVVPLSELERLHLIPGQRIPVRVTKPTGVRRRTLRGVLAGKVRPLPYEDFEEAVEAV